MLRTQHMAARPPIEDLACAAGTLRRASRSLTRLYDVHLARAGLTTMQFSVLWTLQWHGGSLPLAALVDDLVVERTSLYRVLTPLRRAGLVSIRSGADRRAREIAITSRATKRIAAAMPCWIAAQRSVLDRFGYAAWTRLAAQVQAITAVARQAPGA